MHRSPHHYTWALHAPSSVALSLYVVCTASAAGLLRVQSQHLSFMLDAGHIVLSDGMRFIFFDSVCDHWPTCTLTAPEVKDTKHLVRYQSFIVHQSSSQVWNEMNEKGVCTAAFRSYHALSTKQGSDFSFLVLHPWQVQLSVFSGIIIVWCVMTKCGHLH